MFISVLVIVTVLISFGFRIIYVSGLAVSCFFQIEVFFSFIFKIFSNSIYFLCRFYSDSGFFQIQVLFRLRYFSGSSFFQVPDSVRFRFRILSGFSFLSDQAFLGLGFIQLRIQDFITFRFSFRYSTLLDSSFF
jgi:hypothetical protein